MIDNLSPPLPPYDALLYRAKEDDPATLDYGYRKLKSHNTMVTVRSEDNWVDVIHILKAVDT